MATGYENNDYHMIKLSYYRGMIVNYMIAFIAILFYIRIDLILFKCNFNEDAIEIAHKMILYLIPSILLQSFNEVTKMLLVSLKISAPFCYMNCLLIIFLPLIGHLLIIRAGLGILGFAILKFINEIIIWIYQFCLLNLRANIDMRDSPSFKEIFKEFPEHICMVFRVTVNWFFEYLGFEFATVLVCL